MRANQQLSEAIPENASEAPSQTVIGLEPNGSGSFEESLLHALQPMRLGDFTVRLAGDQAGLPGKIADAFNDVIAASQQMARQLEHVGNAVGREGKHASAKFSLSHGAWGEMETSGNTLIDELLWPATAVTGAIGAVAQGDLNELIPLEAYGRPRRGNSYAPQRSSTR